MRILALTNLYPPHYLGGYELICYMVVNELRARGHDVQILTSDHMVSGKRSVRENGIERTLKVVFDLMTIKFMASYQTKPIYVFGSFGMLAFAISFLAGLYALFLKIFHRADFVQTPLPILAIVMFAVGIQFVLMGLLAEMLVRTYHESQAKPIYAVRERLGFSNE